MLNYVTCFDPQQQRGVEMELQNDVHTHGSAKLAAFMYAISGKVTQSGKNI